MSITPQAVPTTPKPTGKTKFSLKKILLPIVVVLVVLFSLAPMKILSLFLLSISPRALRSITTLSYSPVIHFGAIFSTVPWCRLFLQLYL